MSISAQIIADSINPKGCRLTTYILEYPRFIHSELLTHRCFSKNAASSRAIPVEKMIEEVIANPATPVWWGKNQSGMQAKEELDDTNKCFSVSQTVRTKKGLDHTHTYDISSREAARQEWLNARDRAVDSARSLIKIGAHKQIVNRLLETWFNIRIILSGTEFENFFALRAHPDAQPEFQALAYRMLECYNNSQPKLLLPGKWHVPFGDQIEIPRLLDVLNQGLALQPASHIDFDDPQSILLALGMKVAVARCARISYLNHEGKDDYVADIKLCDRLFGSVPRHLSPTEHVAQCIDNDSFIGNFKGWKQYRYQFADQSLKDERVLRS